MNFALVMFLLLLFTGAVWLLDHFVLKRGRSPGQREPWWVEYPKSFFPVILIVFLLRSFLVEPFKIPSGSMLPTLLVGDFILVNKYTYGIRLPIVNMKLIDVNEPHPRLPEFMLQPRFSDLRNECYAVLRDEIRQAMAAQQSGGPRAS